tara:strand:+ start:13643 stop:15952 length:2310 start_codon:yes stop_codon:yes gene_type:complete
MWDAIEAATPAPTSEAPNEVAVNIQTLDEPEDFNATVKEDVSKIIAETQPKQESAISKKVIHGAPPPVEQVDAQETDSQAVRVSLDPNVQVETSRSTIEAMPSVIVDEIYKQKIVGTRSSMDENAQPSKEEPLIELQESLLVGQQFGQYKIEGLLHKTDFGAVYKAQHTYLQQTAHLEVFPLKQGDSTKLSEDFRKFATKYMQFKHPYAVQWTDFGEIPKTGFYAVKEQFESKSLAERFASREPFPTHRIRRIIEQLTHVLEKAHLSDFLHEDIRPENVHITLNALGEETIKLGGFGIQSVYKKHNCRPLSKEIRHRMAQYNSPEQDKAPRFVGPRSDLYSLGVLLFELLTGRPPFNESDTSLLLKDHVITPPPTLKEVASWEKWHPELEAFIQTALAKESAGRPAGVAAFRDACLQAIDAQLQKDFVSASGSHPALPAVGQQAAQTAQQPDPSTFLSTPAPAQDLGGFDEQEFDRDFSAFDALDDDLPSSKKNMMLPIMLGVIAVLLIAIWFFLPSGKKTDNKNPNRRTKITKRPPSEPRETKVGMTNVERRTPPPKRVEEPSTGTPDAATAPDVSEPSTPPPARRIERRPPPVRRRRIVRPRRRIVRPRRRIVKPRRRVIIARRRAPSPLAGKANALKKAFTSWKSSHRLHYKDITGASRLYSKARSLMKKRKYSAAISTLEALKKKFGNYAKLTRPVMQKKFSRLQAAHKWAKKKKRVPEGTLKSVENQQFPKIYMFFMKGNFTSMNKAMNKAFTTLKTNPSRFSP